MTSPLSNDLREHVMQAIEAGESCRSVAARFNIAVSSAVKWLQRYRDDGFCHPQQNGRPPQACSIAVLKKRCSPLSRAAPTLPDSASDGVLSGAS